MFVGSQYSVAGACLSLLDPFTNIETADKYLLVTRSAMYISLQKQMCYFSKLVLGYFNCVTIVTMQFYVCSDEMISCGGS